MVIQIQKNLSLLIWPSVSDGQKTESLKDVSFIGMSLYVKKKVDITWILSVTAHINCNGARCLINVVYLASCAFIRS